MIYLFLSATGNYVPLPGIQDISTEQQTIIETINKVIQSSVDFDRENQQECSQSDEFCAEDKNNLSKTELNKQNKASVDEKILPVSTEHIKQLEEEIKNNSNSTNIIKQGKDIQNNDNNANNDNDAATNVLHIESHLIETYDDYQTENASVGIVELKPKQIELSQGTSKIESDTNLRTVVEVDPCGSKSKKLIEKQISIVNHPKFNAEFNNTEEQVEKEIEIKNVQDKEKQQINEQSVKVEEKFEEKEQIDEKIVEDEPLLKKAEQIEEVVVEEEPKTEKKEQIKEKADEENTILKKVEQTKNRVVEVEPLLNKKEQLKVRAVEEEQIEEDAVKQTAGKLVDDIEKEILTTISKYTFTDKNKDENLTEELVVEIERVLNNTLDKQNNTHTNEDNKLISKIEREVLEAIDEKLNNKDTTTDKTDKTDTTKVDQVLQLDKTSSINHIINGNNKSTSVTLENLDQKPENINVSVCTTPTVESHSSENNKSEKKVSHLPTNNDIKELADDCKREYYKSLRRYLLEKHTEKPLVPLATYLWEDLRRAKERGGYPWTHLYKRPLGPDEYPDFSSFLRKNRGNRFTSESPKSTKRVRIDDQVLVKETECYIQDLSTDDDDEHIESIEEDEDEHSLHSENFSCTSDSIFAIEKSKKSKQLKKLYNIFKPVKKRNLKEDTHSLPDYTTEAKNKHFENAFSSPDHKKPRCYPIMKKLKNMADRQKKRLNIKRVNLKKDNNIVLGEETKILKLKQSPKADRESEIPHFIEKQDSDDILEIVELDESPSRKRRDDEPIDEPAKVDETNKTIIIGETKETETFCFIQNNEELSQKPNENNSLTEEPPKKAPRLRREHVYEEIGDKDINSISLTPDIFEKNSLKASLTKQDNIALSDIESTKNFIPLDRMGSSEEEVVGNVTENKVSHNLLAPISSIDSTSSDEVDLRHKPQLLAVVEESDTCSVENKTIEDIDKTPTVLNIQPMLKKERSPTPSDKKVTFLSDVEPHREDIELAPEVQIATAAASKKWKNIGDHEYEAIETPSDETDKMSQIKNDTTLTDIKLNKEEPAEFMKIKDEEVKNFKLEIDESQLEDIDLTDLQDGDEPPLKPDSTKKGLIASAQDRTRKVHAGLVNQADKIKNKFRFKTQKPLQESPNVKETSKPSRTLEFSKIKMPEMKKLRNFKRPKLNAPDLSKFKITEKLQTLKLGRSKSFKENEVPYNDDENVTVPAEGDTTTSGEAQPPKKFFDIGFGTYPRALRKKKTMPPQLSLDTTATTGTEDPSLSQSIGTPPSADSASTPQGDRGPGPVRSRWADKFSDVSYNDSEGSRYRRYDSEQESEGSRYRRYGSEQESFDRDDSLLDEQRLKEDLDNTSNETPKLGILSVSNKKQFADFDEENRAIHKISDLRAVEFKRRPLQHQDSDLRSEDSKDAEGWTDKEILKNKLLRKAELDAEAGFLKYSSDDFITNETQSTASSGKKVVMEEIDDDEFFLRKRGISEDNIEIRQYISDIIREGYDTPINSLRQVGRHSEPYEYDHGYDVPPPKPRRLRNTLSRSEDEHHHFEQQNIDPDNFSMSQNGSDFFDAAPKRPQRKRQNHSMYSRDSQDRQIADEPRIHENYFDDDEEYLRPPKTEYGRNIEDISRPEPPQRQKRRLHESSMERDSYINGFSGRSVSNSYLQKEEEDTTEIAPERLHRNITLATPENYSDGGSMLINKSKSVLENDENFVNNIADTDSRDKYIIDMLENENDGYAVVRKENLPKPTPPARRKKFSRKNLPPERPPPPQNYNPTAELGLNGIEKDLTMDLKNAKDYDDEYEEPEFIDEERPESPKNLQSGDIIYKMKYRPLPPPPRPPREKRLRGEDNILTNYQQPESAFSSSQEHVEMTATSSTADSYDTDQHLVEIEVSTQTDPLPDDFYIEDLEITDEMKIIEPRVPPSKTLNHLPWEQKQQQQEPSKTEESGGELNEHEQLLKGLQRFRDSNQRSISEKSRASSQADRSRSLSRPQTPSAIVIERRVSTPISSHLNETMVEASLVVRPIDDSLLEDEIQHEDLFKETDIEQSKSDEDILPSEEEMVRSIINSIGVKPANEELLSDEDTKKFSIDDYLKSKELHSDEDGKHFSIDDYLKSKELHSDEDIKDFSSDDYLKSKELHSDEDTKNFSIDDYLKSKELHSDEDIKDFSSDDYLKSKELHSDEDTKNFSIDDYLKSKELHSDEDTKNFSIDDYLKSKELHSDEDTKNFSIDDYLKSKELLSDESKEFSQDEYPVEELLSDDETKKLSLDEYLSEETIKSQLKSSEEHLSDTVKELKRESDNYKIETVQLELRQDYKETSPEVEIKKSEIRPLEKHFEIEETLSKTQESAQDFNIKAHDFEINQPPPQPPPRRKSMTTTAEPDIEVMAISETNKFIKEITPEKTVDIQNLLEQSGHVRDLEVERLRVHALQAGQIMVSQLHGAQISSDELDCKSGNLIIKNIELPPGLIEDIVERVRNKDRSHLSTTETQTTDSTESIIKKSTEHINEAPTKPPRQRNVESLPKSVDNQTNLDEETQTDSNFSILHPSTLQNMYPSIEYLQSLAPLAFYNMGRMEQESKLDETNVEQKSSKRHHYKRRSSSIESKNSTEENQEQSKSSRHTHSRKTIQQQSPEDQQTITQAGRQLVSACNISLIRTINQLTSAVQDQNMDARLRQIPPLGLLFIVITLALLIYLFSGKSVHTHHWDFFNPPGSDGRQS